jgi:hypothetical protein
VRLRPSSVSDNWIEIREILKLSWPPSVPMTEESMSGMLQSILVERLVAWAIFEDDKLAALFTTVVVEDTIVNNKNLMIYTLGSVTALRPAIFMKCYNMLRDYGKELGCKFIIARSNNKAVINMAKQVGGDSTIHLIQLEV